MGRSFQLMGSGSQPDQSECKLVVKLAEGDPDLIFGGGNVPHFLYGTTIWERTRAILTLEVSVLLLRHCL